MKFDDIKMDMPISYMNKLYVVSGYAASKSEHGPSWHLANREGDFFRVGKYSVYLKYLTVFDVDGMVADK